MPNCFVDLKISLCQARAVAILCPQRNRVKKRMSSNVPARPERTTIAGSLEIPRMLNGLWQLAGGHDQHVDIASASDAMDAL